MGQLVLGRVGDVGQFVEVVPVKQGGGREGTLVVLGIRLVPDITAAVPVRRSP